MRGSTGAAVSGTALSTTGVGTESRLANGSGVGVNVDTKVAMLDLMLRKSLLIAAEFDVMKEESEPELLLTHAAPFEAAVLTSPWMELECAL